MVASGHGKVIVFGSLLKTGTHLHGHCDPLAGRELQAGNPCPGVTNESDNGVTTVCRGWQSATGPGLVGAHWGPQSRNLKREKYIFLKNRII